MTQAEFKALARYECGRIKSLPSFYFLLTQAQINQLDSDDFSYVIELKQEMQHMIAQDL